MMRDSIWRGNMQTLHPCPWLHSSLEQDGGIPLVRESIPPPYILHGYEGNLSPPQVMRYKTCTGCLHNRNIL